MAVKRGRLKGGRAFGMAFSKAAKAGGLAGAEPPLRHAVSLDFGDAGKHLVGAFMVLKDLPLQKGQPKPDRAKVLAAFEVVVQTVHQAPVERVCPQGDAPTKVGEHSSVHRATLFEVGHEFRGLFDSTCEHKQGTTQRGQHHHGRSSLLNFEGGGVHLLKQPKGFGHVLVFGKTVFDGGGDQGDASP